MTIEMRIDVPAESRFVSMVCALAAHGARHVGCNDADAVEFVSSVEDSIREQFTRRGSGAIVSVTVRQTRAALEVVIGTPPGARTVSLVI